MTGGYVLQKPASLLGHSQKDHRLIGQALFSVIPSPTEAVTAGIISTGENAHQVVKMTTDYSSGAQGLNYALKK